ncbi:2-hydroxyacid dehydrogenase [Actibacterium mucosum KCTC 23349]|uniref:2-hydroxyacid dehydrogenase n=1 Tax=Actibacterium mucosum KCTC 23349 TaxID=1454373 RepID=A0A037ZKX7_9RHOB|nr:D-glycerate dehydrogenase [Actibacterium mucosum]KAJ56202.1 2-hydroxyacid dehydrogenase [Actibacterium mucosum KCTC 23349]
MTKILLTRPFPEAVIEAAQQLGDVELRDNPEPMTATELRAALALYDAIMPTLGDRVTEELLAEFETPRTKILANFGVGYNHINAEACRAKGIVVSNTPGAVTDATADIAMTLILMSCRRAGEGERMVRAGKWEGWTPIQMLGTHVTGRKLGVVGMGRIGKAIAARCHNGFGMEIAFYNRSRVADAGVPATQMDSLSDLANWAEIIVVAVPGSPQTHHMINAEFFQAMQSRAHFVNIARGDVVDEAALITALQTGQIAAAGLDVYEFEPEVPEALRVLDNVTLLPHLGTAALEVRERMGLMAVENIRAVLAGEVPPNAV